MKSFRSHLPKSRRSYLVALLFAACASAGGCCHCPPPGIQGHDRLNPHDLLTLNQIVNAINLNNQKIPTLWASLNYSATINENGQAHSVSSDDGVLLFQRPGAFRLVGKKEFVGTVFDIGANDRQYWLEVVPGAKRLWWGNFADLGQVDASRLPIPIRPDLVLDVLGVATINTDLSALPAPTLRYDGAADAYVLTFIVKAPDRWIAEKEIWYDRRTLRPWRVMVYDADGRPVLTARLSHDLKVVSPGVDPAHWPLAPGDYKLFFPDTGSRMEFTLKDVRLYKQLGRVRIPNSASFTLPDVQGTDIRATQIGGGGGE